MTSEEGLREVFVKGIFLVNMLGGTSPAVLLEDEDGLVLPIHIGQAEALSIDTVMRNETLPRPMTHDLLVSILERMEVEIDRVFIDEKIDNVYYARLVLNDGRRHMEFDARPSDCIAMALRTGARIMISEDLIISDAVSKDLLKGSRSLSLY
ncbi:MAG: bifunctional nuclease family protein [Methanomethylovorans sp.]|uniref:bifunctional nuclease family protein n=1 Tax=Methanomethylovorans sp. TaxID=2758717 RepID=UPI000B0FD80B|nr:bifunctional nuclease family protein [Methanomethylovorans sp.]